MRTLKFVLFWLVLMSFSGHDALADKRVALVIGNAAYQHVPKLPNPANDAEAVGILFKSAGFDSVQTYENLAVSDMRRVVRDFSDQARDADIAVIYYAGHGMELGGVNYLVPIDASLRRDIDTEDETVSLDRLLQVMEPAKRLRLVILDACRDNPFVKTMKRTMASRSIGRGLASVEPTTANTLIAFAAKGGSTADDGADSHSPFTTALLNNITAPGLDLRIAFGRVRDQVLQSTSGQQEPFVYGSLGGGVVTLSSQTNDEHSNPHLIDPNAVVARDYEAAAKVGTKEVWDAFLAAHSTGFYAELARAQRAKLIGSNPAAALPQYVPPDAGKLKRPPKLVKPVSASKHVRRLYSREWCREHWSPAYSREVRLGNVGGPGTNDNGRRLIRGILRDCGG